MFCHSLRDYAGILMTITLARLVKAIESVFRASSNRLTPQHCTVKAAVHRRAIAEWICRILFQCHDEIHCQ